MLAQLLCHNICQRAPQNRIALLELFLIPTLSLSLSGAVNFLFCRHFPLRADNLHHTFHRYCRPGAKLWKVREHQGERSEEWQLRPEQSRGAQQVRASSKSESFGRLCKQPAHVGKVCGVGGKGKAARPTLVLSLTFYRRNPRRPSTAMLIAL